MIIFEEKELIKSFEKKYIFLDIDGVLTEFPHAVEEDTFKKDKRYFKLQTDVESYYEGTIATGIRRDLLDNLKYILKETNAILVLSTNWKCHTDRTWMKNLEKELKIKISEATPTIVDPKKFKDFIDDSSFTKAKIRGMEISEYIKKNNCKSFVILDDLPLHEHKEFKYKDNFICTNNGNNYGLTKLKAELAVKILNEGKKSNIKFYTPEIDFPKNEITNLKNSKELKEWHDKDFINRWKFEFSTTRVDKEYNKFFNYDLVKSPWGELLIVVRREDYTRIEDHPFYKELSETQIKTISKFPKYCIIYLRRLK